MAAQSDAPFSVSGKTAIVTGSGSGINLAFASLLLSRNCNVIFADLSLRPEAQKVVDAHSESAEGKARAVFVKTDVTDWAQLSRTFEVADNEFSRVDIVCPGAGIFEPSWSNFWHPPGSPSSKDSPTGGRYASLDVNLTHPIRTTQLAIAAFLNPSEGSKVSLANPKRIIHISSIAAQMTPLNSPIYVATKHAISGFVRSLAALDSIGIRVNGVAPGVVGTPLWMDSPEKLKYIDEKDEFVRPEEVAEAMLACLEDPTMVGGTILEVGLGQTRKVQALNDPGPSGRGHTVSNQKYNEVFEWPEEEGWGKVKADEHSGSS